MSEHDCDYRIDPSYCSRCGAAFERGQAVEAQEVEVHHVGIKMCHPVFEPVHRSPCPPRAAALPHP